MPDTKLKIRYRDANVREVESTKGSHGTSNKYGCTADVYEVDAKGKESLVATYDVWGYSNGDDRLRMVTRLHRQAIEKAKGGPQDHPDMGDEDDAVVNEQGDVMPFAIKAEAVPARGRGDE